MFDAKATFDHAVFRPENAITTCAILGYLGDRGGNIARGCHKLLLSLLCVLHHIRKTPQITAKRNDVSQSVDQALAAAGYIAGPDHCHAFQMISNRQITSTAAMNM